MSVLRACKTPPPTQSLALGDLLAKLIRDLASDDHHDDTAIVGIRWQQ